MSTEASSVPDAGQSGAAVSNYDVQQRKKKQKRRIITGNNVSCKGVVGGSKPTCHLFIKRITKDTKNEAVQNMIQSYGFCIRAFRCISHSEARFKSFKLSVPASQFERLFDEKLATGCGCEDIQDTRIWSTLIYLTIVYFFPFFSVYFLFVYSLDCIVFQECE